MPRHGGAGRVRGRPLAYFFFRSKRLLRRVLLTVLAVLLAAALLLLCRFCISAAMWSTPAMRRIWTLTVPSLLPATRSKRKIRTIFPSPH